MTNGHVAQLWRYPVKSLGGGQVEHTEIGERGVLGDRLWAVRDIERDVTASARQLPVLLTATARYLGPVPPDAGPGNVPEVEITFPDGTVLSSSDDGVHAKLSELAGRDVRLTALPACRRHQPAPADPRGALRNMSPAFLRAAFGVAEDEKLPDLSMVRMSDLATFTRYSTPPGMFVDLAPVHVLSQTSLATIGAEIGSDVDVRRFRPNVLLALDDPDDGLPESHWTGARLDARRCGSRHSDADDSLRSSQPRATGIRGRSPNHQGGGVPALSGALGSIAVSMPVARSGLAMTSRSDPSAAGRKRSPTRPGARSG